MNRPVRLIGLPTDSHSSFLRGAAAAPAAIRAALASDHGNMAAENGLEIGIDIVLEDAGDLPLTEGEGDAALIRAAFAVAARQGAVPIGLGGDHMVSFPCVAGLAGVHGPLEILHFDAHSDLYDDFEGDPLSHASPFARIMEAGLARRLVQVGIRTLNRHTSEQAPTSLKRRIWKRERARGATMMRWSPVSARVPRRCGKLSSGVSLTTWPTLAKAAS